MTTAADVIAVARTQIGYEEGGGPSGHDGNITKYWAELDEGLQGQFWCAAFVSWCFKHAGHQLPAIDRPYGYISCLDAMNWAKEHGLWSESGHYAPGDCAIYGGGEHTGLIVFDDGVNMHTIEGNTSPTSGGDQANGGGVYDKVRPHNDYVSGAFQASKLLGATPTDIPPPPPAAKPVPAPATGGGALAVDGQFGRQTIAAMQRMLGVAADGVFGYQTKRALQGHLRVQVDGVIGPVTVRALQAHVGAGVDGDWGPDTTRHLQTALNTGRF